MLVIDSIFDYLSWHLLQRLSGRIVDYSRTLFTNIPKGKGVGLNFDKAAGLAQAED